jgi:hypothetical protein
VESVETKPIFSRIHTTLNTGLERSMVLGHVPPVAKPHGCIGISDRITIFRSFPYYSKELASPGVLP